LYERKTGKRLEIDLVMLWLILFLLRFFYRNHINFLSGYVRKTLFLVKAESMQRLFERWTLKVSTLLKMKILLCE